MGIADEIRELKALRDDGTLTEAEFAEAKASLLADPSAGRRRAAGPAPPADAALGAAAKSWVKFQIVMGVVGVLLALIFFFGFFLPQWNRTNAGFDRRWNEFPRPELPKDGR